MLLLPSQMNAAQLARFNDSTLGYIQLGLEAVDRTLNMPLKAVTWQRDIKLRGGISPITSYASFQRRTFGVAGNSAVNGQYTWRAKRGRIQAVSVNGEKVTYPLHAGSMKAEYDVDELAESQALGMPIDVEQVTALREAYQMQVDRAVYIGDTDNTADGFKGLLNLASVTVDSATGTWDSLTADQIIADFDTGLLGAWAASGYSVFPNKAILTPTALARISSLKVSTAGNVSLRKYIQENNIMTQETGTPLRIVSTKWNPGAGVGAVDRAMFYNDSAQYVRFSLSPLTPRERSYAELIWSAPYTWKIGRVEDIYPETMFYLDGI